MKFWTNLKWLFTNAPTNITLTDEPMKCDYCGSETLNTHYIVPNFIVCQYCMKKVYDTVLTKEKPDA